ncbi:uncharacterized protein LOC113146907 [Cyclospora cayetanensis]|uniref:Uncharacterized protein LOC113146907 n=1 Tax=Cyclospora cayetanensis TaxID=88456 RepID=A0A6P6RWA8_9EIME|nr:uncharacterized protein LOC113146907 [Cyclospora cayetanensis]
MPCAECWLPTEPIISRAEDFQQQEQHKEPQLPHPTDRRPKPAQLQNDALLLRRVQGDSISQHQEQQVRRQRGSSGSYEGFMPLESSGNWKIRSRNGYSGADRDACAVPARRSLADGPSEDCASLIVARKTQALAYGVEAQETPEAEALASEGLHGAALQRQQSLSDHSLALSSAAFSDNASIDGAERHTSAQQPKASSEQNVGLHREHKQKLPISQQARLVAVAADAAAEEQEETWNNSSDILLPENLAALLMEDTSGERQQSNKRRPGGSSCWYQTALLLQSLLLSGDQSEEQHCSEFCAFLCCLLQDARVQQTQHERMQYLLLQLLLLLLQQRLACPVCCCDRQALRKPTELVVQQLKLQLQELQQGGICRRTEQLLLNVDSLQQQKQLALYMQLALLLRAWRPSSGIPGSSSKIVIVVAFHCVLHGGVGLELRESASDVLAAAALDELSVDAGRTEVDTAANATLPSATVGAPAASALGLCCLIIKAARSGSSAAAAAAAEVASSVACGFLLLLQKDRQPSAALRAATVRRAVCAFSAEVAAPAFLILLRLLLPAVKQPLLHPDTMQGTAPTPLPLSQHAAESFHLVRLASALQQRPLQLQPLREQDRHHLSSLDGASVQHKLQQKLEQDLLLLLGAAMRRAREQLALLLSLLQRDWPPGRENRYSSKAKRVVEEAAAAVEAPLTCVCVLVQLPRVRAAANFLPLHESLDAYVATLVELLLMLLGLEESAAATAAAGCLSKVIVALTEAARSIGKQMQSFYSNHPFSDGGSMPAESADPLSAAAGGATVAAAAAAAALQDTLATAAAAVMRFSLDSARLGQVATQQQQMEDFLAAAVNADTFLLPTAQSHMQLQQQESQQQQQPLASKLLQQILEFTVARNRQCCSDSCSNTSSDKSISQTSSLRTACSVTCRRFKPPIAFQGKLDAQSPSLGRARGSEEVCHDVAATFRLSVVLESNATVVLHALASCLSGRIAVSCGHSSAAALKGSSAAASAQLCLPSRASSAQATAKPPTVPSASAASGAATTIEEPAACFGVAQQHALAIIEARGGLVAAFAEAAAAVTASEGQQHAAQQQALHHLQQNFSLLVHSATATAAHVVLALEQPGTRTACCSLRALLGNDRWSAAQQQYPVAVLQQLLQVLLDHHGYCLPSVDVVDSSGNDSNSCCLWVLLLRVAVAVSSLRAPVLRLCMHPLRRLLAGQKQRQLSVAWKQICTFFTGELICIEFKCSTSCSCCSCKIGVHDLMQQDDWVLVSDLLLELLQLLQQTASSVSAAVASAIPCLKATEKTVQQEEAKESAYQGPPENQ